jgi:chromate transporter
MSPPPTFFDWFWLNLKIGALSFGGSGRILLYQDAVVKDREWMTEEEFKEVLTLAMVFPGPNLVNLSMYLGRRLVGLGAGAAGVLGLGVPGAFVALAIVGVVSLADRNVAWIFQGFSLGSVALFVLFVWRLVSGLTARAPSATKLVARALIAVGVGIASLLLVPLPIIIFAAIGVCLAVEFGLR